MEPALDAVLAYRDTRQLISYRDTNLLSPAKGCAFYACSYPLSMIEWFLGASTKASESEDTLSEVQIQTVEPTAEAISLEPLTPQENSDKLAIFRAQVQEEANTRGKMSDVAVAKLRSQTEAARVEAIGLTRFGNALKSVVVTPANLQTLITRCIYAGPPEKNLDRRAHKLLWWITAGFRLGEEINAPGQIRYEERMTDAQFQKAWDMKAAEKVKQRRTEQGLVSNTKPERLCKSGSKCMKVYRRKAAPAKGDGEYCSTACGTSDRARAKRLLLAGPPSTEMTQ
jgi:hypothetical protein